VYPSSGRVVDVDENKTGIEFLFCHLPEFSLEKHVKFLGLLLCANAIDRNSIKG
jgi:hypothetical protein